MPVAEKVINISKHRIGGIPPSIHYFGKQSNKNFNCTIIPSVIITLITVSGERSLPLLRKTSIYISIFFIRDAPRYRLTWFVKENITVMTHVCLPFPKSSATIKVISLKQYAFVPCVESKHNTHEQYFLFIFSWNSLCKISKNEFCGKLGNKGLSEPWDLYAKTGLKVSCCISATIKETY